MAVNPSAQVIFEDGNLRAGIAANTGTPILIGAATGGPLLRPTFVSSTSSVLQWLFGPLVANGAHHCDYSGGCYLMRCNASTPGAIGSVTKTPAPSSPASLSTMTAALTSYTLHATIEAPEASSALNVTTGWTAPSAPLPVTVTSGAGTVSHTLTFTYIDTNGDVQTGTLAVTAAGTATTTFSVASVLSVTSNVAPVGTVAFAAAFTSPGDRLYARVRGITGGVLGVTGGTLPVVQLSLDDGKSYSRSQQVPSDGVMELVTYAGGLAPQATGVTLTFSAGTLAREVYGSLRVAGATTPGDVLYTKKVSSAVTVTHTVTGTGTTFLVSVSGTAITVRSATDGGGVATSTANDVAAGILASTAASALVYAEAVGAGTGLMAAASSAGFANSSVSYTPKQEGVQVRHGDPGASNATLTVTTVGKRVTIYPVTDSNGIQTSTAAQVETAVNASATASLLLSADASGSGAGLVEMLGTYYALPVSVATGDQYSFAATPPAWTTADLAEAYAVLKQDERALDGFSVAHVIGVADQTALDETTAFRDALADEKRKYKRFVHEATYQGATSESTWVANLLADYTQASSLPASGLVAGEVNTINSAYGTVDRRSSATSYVSRLMICSISELPSHVDCTTDLGIQNAISGVQERSGAGQTMPLWQSEDALIQLNAANFVTLRTLPGRTGIYVRQGLMFVVDEDDYLYVTNARTADAVAAVANDEIYRNLNANMLVDPATGQLAEIEIQRIESQVEDRVRRDIMGGQRQHISGVRCVLDRGGVFTGTITGQLRIVGRFPATTITLRLGYQRTL